MTDTTGAARLSNAQRNVLLTIAGQIIRELEAGICVYEERKKELESLLRINWQTVSLTWKTVYVEFGEDDLLATPEKAAGQSGRRYEICVSPEVQAWVGRNSVQAELFTCAIPLVRVSGKDLGFSSYHSIEEMRGRAKLCGLKLCLMEIPFRLRRQYLDQSEEERLTIMTETWDGEDDLPRLFCVGRDKEDDPRLHLYSIYALPDNKVDPENEWIFVRGDPQQKSKPSGGSHQRASLMFGLTKNVLFV